MGLLSFLISTHRWRRLASGIHLLVLAAASVPISASAADSNSEAAGVFAKQVERLLALTPESITSEASGRAIFDLLDQTVHGLGQVDETEKSLELAKRGRVLFPGQMRSGLLLGWAQGMSGELEPAIATTRAALAEKTDQLPDTDQSAHAEGLTNLGGFLIQLGEYSDSVPVLEQARKENPASALPDYLAGLAYHELREPWLCAKAYEKALKKDESLASSNDYLFYAWALDQMKQLEKSGEVLRSAVDRHPMGEGLHLNLGLNFEAQSATREAYYEYRLELLLGEDTSPYADEAKKRIERIERIQVNTPYPEPELKAVVEYLRRKAENNQDLAGKLLKTAVDLNGMNHPLIVHLRAQDFLDNSEFDKAIEVIEGAKDPIRNHLLLQIDLVESYAKAGAKDKADALLQKLILVAPNHWKLRALLGPAEDFPPVGH